MAKIIRIGSTVTIKHLKYNVMFTKTIKYQKHKTRPVGGTGSYRDLYYTSEVQPEKLKENIITDASPLGQALIGRKIGDIVSVKGHNYKILDINNIN